MDDVDIYYRFTSDLEPTDQQWDVIMHEVSEEVQKESKWR
jgi:hypothetical protein